MTKEKPLAEWTDEELALVLLSQLWRIYDAGGISDGRSYEAVLLEAARQMLPIRLPPGGQVEDRPNDEMLLREVSIRRSKRIRADLGH